MTGTWLGGQVSLHRERTNQACLICPQGLPIQKQILRILRPALSPHGKSLDSLPSQREPHILQAVLRDGLPHRQTTFMLLAGLYPLSQNSSLPRGCPLSSPNLPVLRGPRGGGSGCVHQPAFLGQVEGSLQSLSRHTRPETSRE